MKNFLTVLAFGTGLFFTGCNTDSTKNEPEKDTAKNVPRSIEKVMTESRKDESLQKLYQKKNQKVYFRDPFGKYQIMEDADTKTFERLTRPYSRDATHVYYAQNVIPGVKVGKFEILDKHYAKDNQMVFFHGRMILGADPETFELIGNFYAKDKNFVYYRDKPLKNQNPETFSGTDS